jgi:hypothetical protein
MGRPSKFNPEIIPKIYEYIDITRNELVETKVRMKYYRGEACPEEYHVGAKMPTIWELGSYLNVRTMKLYEWEKKFPELEEALKEYREMQKHFLIQNSLRGYYKEHFSMFVMKNITDWTDTPKVKIDPKSLSDEELVRYAKMALALMGGENEAKA